MEGTGYAGCASGVWVSKALTQDKQRGFRLRCPRCRTLCTEAELRPAIYDRTAHMIINADDARLRPYTDDAADSGGREVWLRQEVRKKAVCDACIEEMRRGKMAHRTPREKWTRRVGWRSA